MNPSSRYTSVADSMASATDEALLDGIRSGDERAWTTLVGRHHGPLVRLARLYVATESSAADVVQDTWLAVLNQLDGFEGRSSFKTWLFRILINKAQRRGTRDARQIPFSSTTRLADDPYGGAVDNSRLKPASDPVEPLHWMTPPSPWPNPERGALSSELREVVDGAIGKLSPAQREVITMRDILGWEAGEVADALGITENNQRVLLHRARSNVRNRIEEYVTT